MRAQAELDRLADRIEADTSESDDSGISGFVVDAKQNTLKVYWKGILSGAATQEIEQARARGMTVQVLSAPYTQAALRAEAERLVKLNMTDLSTSGPRLVSVGPLPDGSGLELGLSGLGEEVSAAQALDALPALASPVKTHVVAQEPARKVSRFTDSAPFYGGSYMELRVPDGGACTSGFAAQAGGLTFLLTAAHCGQGQWWTGGSPGNYIGATAAREDRGHDAMLIVTQSAPQMYDGGSIAGERPQFTKTVSGASTTRVGDYVCASGSFSGAVCNILATRTGQTIIADGFGTITDVVQADRESTPRMAAVGNGDSGGPVFSLDGNTRVIGRGTISAIPSADFLRDACIGVPGEGQPGGVPGRRCSHRFYYPDITAQMRTLGFTLRTG